MERKCVLKRMRIWKKIVHRLSGNGEHANPSRQTGAKGDSKKSDLLGTLEIGEEESPKKGNLRKSAGPERKGLYPHGGKFRHRFLLVRL